MKAESQKKIYREEIVSEYRIQLKENTVTLSVIDHQIHILAFSLRKLFNYKATVCLPSKEEFISTRDQIFKDTWSIVNEFYPYMKYEAIEDANEWYKEMSRHEDGKRLVVEYYRSLDSSNGVNSLELFQKYVTPYI